MPGADYQAICDAVRTKTGGTDLLKSGDIASVISSIPVGAQVAQGSFTVPLASSLRSVSLSCGFVPSKVLIVAVNSNRTGTYEKLSSNDNAIASFYYCATDEYPCCVSVYSNDGYVELHNLNYVFSGEVTTSNSNGVFEIVFSTSYSFNFPYGNTYYWVAIE